MLRKRSERLHFFDHPDEYIPDHLRPIYDAHRRGHQQLDRQQRPAHGVGWLGLAKLRKLAKFCKFLAGSFSAVSKRNFARKYAFDSIFQALPAVHTFASLQTQHISKTSVTNQQFS